MDHARYAAEATETFHQLSALVTEEDKAAMKELWNKKGFAWLHGWTSKNYELVQQLICRRRTERLPLLKRHAQDRATLLLAGLFYTRGASSVFRAIEDNFLDRGGPYREGVCRAGEAWVSIIEKTMTWPFPE